MQENVAPTSKRDLVEILFSDDGITAYVKLTKPQEGEEPITKQDLLAALETAQVTFGIKEEMIEKLAARPIYGIKMEVVHALPPINGEDGEITYLVKRDTDYKPEFNEEGNIDYKNLDYFQMAHKGQVL
ncbi:MAG: FapA family protein, partial [Eubacteriales bacterium]|nr:FapA family protein [Eubacteriales bacterium]